MTLIDEKLPQSPEWEPSHALVPVLSPDLIAYDMPDSRVQSADVPMGRLGILFAGKELEELGGRGSSIVRSFEFTPVTGTPATRLYDGIAGGVVSTKTEKVDLRGPNPFTQIEKFDETTGRITGLVSDIDKIMRKLTGAEVTDTTPEDGVEQIQKLISRLETFGTMTGQQALGLDLLANVAGKAHAIELKELHRHGRAERARGARTDNSDVQGAINRVLSTCIDGADRFYNPHFPRGSATRVQVRKGVLRETLGFPQMPLY